MKPPRAEQRPTVQTWHGHELVDPFGWLRADNWQDVMKDPTLLPEPIRTHLEVENRYSEGWFAKTSDLRDSLTAEMRARIKEDDSSVPAPDGPWAYSTRYDTGHEYPLFCRRPRSLEGPETILLDGNAEAAGKAFWRIGGFEHSPDHARFLFATDEAGSELYTLRVREIDGSVVWPDFIERVGGAEWAPDSQTIYYVRVDENHRPRSVWRHVLGTSADADICVFEEPDPGYFVSISKTRSGDFLLIEVSRSETGEIHLIDLRVADSPQRLVAARRDQHEYAIEHHKERLFILTNSNGAEDFRICETPVSEPEEAHWREVVPHRPGCLILGIDVRDGYLIRLEREDGLPRIVVRELLTGDEHAIAFDESCYSLSLGGGYEFATTTLRYSYSSMRTPAQVFDYDIATRQRVLRKTQVVPSGHDPSHYVTERLLATARDGESVPVSLLYHRDTPLDGTAPLFLYGYGSYGISIPAGFSTNRLSLVDRGFIFAIAHVRGGKEKGHRWYLDGKREKKVNTFTDFIDVAEDLIGRGFTQKGRIVGQGGSAGGLLMGAVANMAPDLFLALIANVPFVDVLNTMLDASLPLTPPEWAEWGNPVESLAAFETIRSYCPYDQVRAQAYPNILAVAGLTDPRVTYWEPAKWVAKLREANTGPATILLHTNMEAGHAGASGRFESLGEAARDYAFAIELARKQTKITS
ncbi:MAG: S9 family peptidase [Hyphomicrobiaceae bacterium]